VKELRETATSVSVAWVRGRKVVVRARRAARRIVDGGDMVVFVRVVVVERLRLLCCVVLCCVVSLRAQCGKCCVTERSMRNVCVVK
jgi:hypothetical protein